MNDHDWFNQIDCDWDEIVTDSDRPRRGDTMTETMLRLHRLAAEPVPAQTLDRVWTRLAVSSAPTTSRPRRRIPPLRLLWGVLESRPMSAVATVALLVLVALSGYFSINGNRTVAPSDDLDYRLVLFDAKSGDLHEIDPLTLEDIPNGFTFSLGAFATPTATGPNQHSIYWQASDDRTTLVGRETHWNGSGDGRGRQRILIVDARTGSLRQQFPLVEPGSTEPTINASGSRIAVQVDAGIQTYPSPKSVAEGNPVKWDIYDTESGRLLTRIESDDDRDPMAFGSGWLNPQGDRFYRFAILSGSLFPGPWPVDLVVHDAATGQELSRRFLPQVRLGYWPSDWLADRAACNSDDPSITETSPKTWQSDATRPAISPDGTTLAIPHPDGQAVTMVDLSTMQVTRTVTIATPTTSQPQASPIADGETDCQPPIDRFRIGTFSRDGTSLYVQGANIPGTQSQSAPVTDTQLFRIDVATGKVTASSTVANDGQMLVWLVTFQPPDDHNLYVSSAALGDNTMTLQLLDAETLVVRAQRQIDLPQHALVIAK